MNCATVCGALIVSASLISGCTDRWSGFVYPDKNNLSVSRSIGDFQSLAACRDASLSVLSRLPGGIQAGTFECGKNCGDANGSSIRICAETTR